MLLVVQDLVKKCSVFEAHENPENWPLVVWDRKILFVVQDLVKKCYVFEAHENPENRSLVIWDRRMFLCCVFADRFGVCLLCVLFVLFEKILFFTQRNRSNLF